MGRIHKSFIAGVVTASCLFSLNANVALASDATTGKKIAYLTATTSNPFIAKLASTIQEEAKAKGMEVTVLTSPYDPALQGQQINDVVAQKYDILMITPISERAAVPPLTAAKNAGLPVFIVNSPLAEGADDLYVSFIGENHNELGQVTGQALVEAVKGRDNVKVALVTGSLAEGVAPRRLAGFKQVVEQHPNISIVATEDVKWDTATAERVSGQLFARYAAQGGLDAVYGMADNVAHGVILAAKAAGVPLGNEKGKLLVVSSNCMKFGIDHIRSGEQYSTATQMPTRTGKAAVATVVDFLDKKPVKKNNFLEAVAITKANLDTYAEPCTF